MRSRIIDPVSVIRYCNLSLIWNDSIRSSLPNFFILIFSGFSLFVYPAAESLLETEQQPLFLTLEEAAKLAYENCFDIQFLQPMALTITWGLIFATGVILVMIPCAYAIVDDFTEKITHRLAVQED